MFAENRETRLKQIKRQRRVSVSVMKQNGDLVPL